MALKPYLIWTLSSSFIWYQLYLSLSVLATPAFWKILMDIRRALSEFCHSVPSLPLLATEHPSFYRSQLIGQALPPSKTILSSQLRVSLAQVCISKAPPTSSLLYTVVDFYAIIWLTTISPQRLETYRKARTSTVFSWYVAQSPKYNNSQKLTSNLQENCRSKWLWGRCAGWPQESLQPSMQLFVAYPLDESISRNL